MKTERKVLVDGVLYPVILSDEQETLLAAKAAGRVFVGLAEKGGAARLWGAEYVAEAEPEWERENNQKDAGRGAAGTFVGEELVARKVEVTVRDKNNSYAALEEGSLSSEQQVIISTDREVTEGSPVRLQES